MIHKLNNIIVTNSSGERFITFFVARYDHKTKLLEYVNSAHNSPVLYNTSAGVFSKLNASCVGIGMLDEIPAVEKSVIRIDGYSKIVCYTDGLSELRGDDGEEIGDRAITHYIKNKKPVAGNMDAMLKSLGIPDSILPSLTMSHLLQPTSGNIYTTLLGNNSSSLFAQADIYHSGDQHLKLSFQDSRPSPC
jgi:hypothetical protein